jgi:hypothetical protein
MSEAAGKERRKHPRYPVDVSARLTVGNDSLMARMRDVCRDAVLVEANRWFPLQTDVKVAMELPGTGGPLEVAGKVIRLAPGEQGTHSMAILFAELPQAATDRIDFFLTQQG